jgi:hypothetical protein
MWNFKKKRNMKSILNISLLIVILLLTSCNDFLDVNTDPNNPTEVSPSLVLPVGQNYTAQLIQNDRRVNSLGNMMMYNWSQSDGFSWYSDEFKYLVTSSFYRNIFNNSYTQPLKQYQVLEQLTSEYDYYKAIAKIMKAYHYQILVDMYGDIPYTEALLRKENATPVYDDAKTIYEDLIVQLTAAIELIDKAENQIAPGADDITFGGDMDMWKQFANTIKLRILVRQSSMAGRDTYIKEQINAIISEGSGFITSDVGVDPGFLQEENKQNPIWQAYGSEVSGSPTMNNQATCATDYVITYLTNTNDPRIDFIYEEPETGHLGVPQGLLDYDTPVLDAYEPKKVSNIGPGILKSYDQSAIIFSLAESYFNQAEAAFKGLMPGSAKDFYQQGIEASFDYLGATEAPAYYNQVKDLVSYDNSTNKLQAIITQKWIALNGITAEQSWFDYSRTGYPAGLPISLLASTTNRPVRLFYTSDEISSNGANVPSQPNAFTEKIFWGK